MWPLIRLLPQKTNFKFVRFAVFAAALSVLLVLGSIASIVIKGFNYGIDLRSNIASRCRWRSCGRR
jgi:preprotein translocase subunit SecF